MLYLWLKIWHIIAVIAWFAALFYLPRIFVYYASPHHTEARKTLRIMAHKLYYYIMYPAGILTTILGAALLSEKLSFYLAQPWMIAKLFLVSLLWAFHFICGHFLRQIKTDTLKTQEVFFRCFNEFPTIILIATIIVIFLKPTFH